MCTQGTFSPLPSLKRFHVSSVKRGIPLFPLDDPSFVVREGITCSSPAEFAYYSCKPFKNVCAYCGNDDCSVNATLKEQYQTVLQLCSDCESSGKKQSPEVNTKIGLYIVDKQNASLLQLNLMLRKDFRHLD